MREYPILSGIKNAHYVVLVRSDIDSYDSDYSLPLIY